jgi:hypothetical protein
VTSIRGTFHQPNGLDAFHVNFKFPTPNRPLAAGSTIRLKRLHSGRSGSGRPEDRVSSLLARAMKVLRRLALKASIETKGRVTRS